VTYFSDAVEPQDDFAYLLGSIISRLGAVEQLAHRHDTAASAFLPLAGGTLTGALGGTSATFSGAVSAASFSGSGASLTSLNASNLSSGTVPSARISGSYTGITQVGTLSSLTVSSTINGSISGNAATATNATNANYATTAGSAGSYSGDGSSITNLNAGALGFGTVPAARLGDGSSLYNLNASNLASGTVPSARVSGGYTGITSVGTLGSLSVSGTVTAGTFSGSGASLSSLNASNLSSGTVASARISGAYTGITSVGTLGSLSVSGGVSSGDITVNGNLGVYYAGSGAGNWVAFRWSGANVIGRIDNVAEVTLANVSDRRLKTDVLDLDYDLALAHVAALRPVTYRPIDLDGSRLERRMTGLIAQDVEHVLPDLVHTTASPDGDGLKSVDYARLTATLVAAIKGLSLRVAHLERQ
jgi:hypothetical protein